MNAEEAKRQMGGLAAQAGIDTSVCEFCEEPLDDTKEWRRGLDGCGAHEECLPRRYRRKARP